LTLGILLLGWGVWGWRLPAAPLNHALPCSRLIRSADGLTLRLTLASDGQYRLWTPLDRIAPAAVEAILLKEDRHFFRHPGINLQALARAAWATAVRDQRQGGSTLSMQLARRLYRLNTRTIPGKLEQMARALWLEAHYRKKTLLEAYCNLAPMGGNIEGLGTAARIYFAKEADQLTLAESLALAVMPQNPAQRGSFGPEQQQARRRLAEMWWRQHPDDPPPLTLPDAEIKGTDRSHLPFLAPHLTDQLLRDAGQEPVIDTTLEVGLQRLIERIIRQYLAERRHLGLTNGAALLVDRRDMGIKALIGSADFFDVAIDGQVNGVLAKRSPGSTLKPFLYGLALDQGLIHPRSILNDAPTAFGGFQPENFDGRFIGPLSAQEALIRSRNVPAIWLANRLQRPTLHDFLRMAGIARLQSEAHYGLALALGGGELTMEELVGLYAMLANDGLLRPLRYRQHMSSSTGTRLLSPQAAFLVRDMLAANPRPDQRINGSWPVAWKTGTSWGFHDAWTVGLVGDYVLAVWIGHFDGRSNPAFVGLKAAAPLFFRIVDALVLARGQERPEPGIVPDGLARVEVCAASGDLPNRWCPQTALTWFIPGKSPIRVSTLHRPVRVDIRTGLAACPPFDPAVTRLEVFEFWPSDLQRLFRDTGLPRRLPPQPGAGCVQPLGAPLGNPPRLTSPLTDVVYTLHLSKPEETIDLAAAIDADSQRMYWFVDNRYLGSCPRDAVLPWRPANSGRLQVNVVDDQGRSAARILDVAFLP
jgi:penicillin-binding protein 1C